MTSGPADRGDNPIIGGHYGGTQTSGWGSEYGQHSGENDSGESPEQSRGQAENRTHQMTNEAGQKTDQVQNKAEDAKARAEQGKEQAASGIGKAADQMRSRSQEQGGAAGQFGEKVADQLDKTSQYLHEHDTDEMMHDFQDYVRHHPMQAVVGATITGFLLARILP
jgi:ElaB/YqjD/DUF883 family membrane-anchored ribosome-binding protein